MILIREVLTRTSFFCYSWLMKIGIFDSGLGGLVMMEAIVKKLPQYDYMLFADSAHVPYGGRSKEDIYRLTTRALAYMF